MNASKTAPLSDRIWGTIFGVSLIGYAAVYLFGMAAIHVA